MLKGIFILLISLLIIVFIYLFFPRQPMPFLEIENKKELKKILNDTKSKYDDKRCSWYYGHFQEYHLFELECLPKVEPGSFYTVEKRYKIKKSLLKIDDMYIVSYASGDKERLSKIEDKERVSIAVRDIKIHWDNNITK